MIYIPDTPQGLEFYVDAYFSGGWKDDDHDSPESLLSGTGFVIMYAGCPMYWGRNANRNFPHYYRKRVHCSIKLNEIIDSIYESYEINCRFI